jgi:hypothetical protein
VIGLPCVAGFDQVTTASALPAVAVGATGVAGFVAVVVEVVVGGAEDVVVVVPEVPPALEAVTIIAMDEYQRGAVL